MYNEMFSDDRSVRGPYEKVAEWISAARAAQGQAELDVAARRAQVRSQVMAAFYGVAVAQERVRLSDELGRLSSQAREAGPSGPATAAGRR